MVAIPTVHLNGTSFDDLYEQNRNAHVAVKAAWDALAAAGPNGRDYYPQGDLAIKVAGSEHFDRMKKLTEILNDLDRICEAIIDQKPVRK